MFKPGLLFLLGRQSVITSRMKPQGHLIGNQKAAPWEAKEISAFPYCCDFVFSCIVQGRME